VNVTWDYKINFTILFHSRRCICAFFSLSLSLSLSLLTTNISKCRKRETKMLNHMRNFSRIYIYLQPTFIHSTFESWSQNSQIFKNDDDDEERQQQRHNSSEKLWNENWRDEKTTYTQHTILKKKTLKREWTNTIFTCCRWQEPKLMKLFYFCFSFSQLYLRRPAKTSVNNEKIYANWVCICAYDGVNDENL
jgi:hypothetical protein